MINFTPTISQLKMLASLRGNLWSVQESAAVSLALAALELSEKNKRESYWSDDELADYYTLRQKSFIDDSGIAHIEVRGAMLCDCQPIQERVGHAIRYSTIIAETNAAVAAGAKAIIYRINSPGGTVSGNIEASELVASLPIPTIGYCEGMACSAAYKLVSGMSGIVASKSAMIGNIGTILSWSDCSEFWKKWGVNFKAIVSEGADLKSTFHLEPDEKQLAFLQSEVNKAGEQFRNHVTAGRAKVGKELNPEVWRAGWYSGQDGIDMGLADELGSYDEAVAAMKNFLNFDIRNTKPTNQP